MFNHNKNDCPSNKHMYTNFSYTRYFLKEIKVDFLIVVLHYIIKKILFRKQNELIIIKQQHRQLKHQQLVKP